MRKYPTLGAIQRTNVIVACAIALILLALRSPAAALSCLLGASVVIANLYLLALLGRMLLGHMMAAGGSGGGRGTLGAIALPLKLFLVTGLVYVVLFHSGIDGIGFAAGVFSQAVAVLIETARVNVGQQAVAQSGHEAPF